MNDTRKFLHRMWRDRGGWTALDHAAHMIRLDRISPRLQDALCDRATDQVPVNQ